ncbi:MULTISPECIES: T9SS type A sorting domain-containing protein [unclassified Spirosoma]|uniref:T9SS type A sorting domain-containing protein n=1 Tax=unclassified Spirosoma TaxID=2621999 RepID=UPI0009675CFF|nr:MULTISPECIES: T9SS type A sorting domain-containing protein [unclassified Spirosoma]MBN8820647.1 T9SS type A sorting domain-containing protein [Spirosoma sp.]OJW70515.1 MAG: hypothetical protein BGO59_25060 [Spirosoma sp. 48-14]
MKRLLISFLIGWSLLGIRPAIGQSLSMNTVQYMVTYDAALQQFTAWIVPQYDTPNLNNPETSEYGVTAQVTLKTPRDFVLSELKDKVGTWDKQPRKIGTEPIFRQAGADPSFAYFIVGKTPMETNYGSFKSGEPTPLFTFKGTGGDLTQVQVLSNQDAFVSLSDKLLSLNVSCSFYSRSGQSAHSAARPLEQFHSNTRIIDMMKQIQHTTSANMTGDVLLSDGELPFLVYPNPSQGEINLKVFSLRSFNPVTVLILDLNGAQQRTESFIVDAGINTLSIHVPELSTGSYLIKTRLDNKIFVNRFVKH